MLKQSIISSNQLGNGIFVNFYLTNDVWTVTPAEEDIYMYNANITTFITILNVYSLVRQMIDST